MFKKVGISLMAALMLSSVALACDYSSIDDEDFLCEFSLVDDGGNKQESKQEERKVIKFDKEVVKNMLIEDGYSPSSIEETIAGLNTVDARLQDILDAYLYNRTISPEKVNGITLKLVKEKFSESDIWGWIFRMDKYINYPDGVERLEKMNRIDENWADFVKKHSL